jgi:hypothetical protein
MHKDVLYVMCWKGAQGKVKVRVFIFAGLKVIRGC